MIIECNQFISVICSCLSDSNPWDLYCASVCTYLCSSRWINIYIFIAIALDETSILVAVYFLMQNIYQSCDLGRTLERSNIDVNQ